MEEDEYKNLFVDPVVQDTFKPEALQSLNEWYCQAIFDKLEQNEPSQEATDVKALVKQVHICYHCKTGDFIELGGFEDFGEMVDYYFDDNNASQQG